MVGIRRKGQMVDLKVSVPFETYRDFNELLNDPRKNEPAYGYRSLIITELLQGWIKEKKIARSEMIS